MTFSYIVLSDSTLDTLQSFTSIDGWERRRRRQRRMRRWRKRRRGGDERQSSAGERRRNVGRRDKEGAEERGNAFTKK